MQNISQRQQTVEQFLRLCLRGFWDPPCLEAAVALAGQEQLDWAAFRRAAREENLAPLLYQILRQSQIVPAAVEDGLREAYYRLAGYNSILLHELERLLCCLAVDSVPVLLLKGAALVKTVYGNAGVRPMVDVDLMVPMAHVDTAQSALANLGYEMSTSDPWPGFSWRYRNSVAYARRSGRGLPLRVGLHSQPFSVPYYERIPLSEWFARAQPAPDAGPGARVPAPEDHLVYLCGHLALHHQYDPALLRFVDIALLVQRTGKLLDWSQVVDRAQEWHLVIPLQRTLIRLGQLWPEIVSDDVVRRVTTLRPTRVERWVHKWVVDHPRNPTRHTLLSLATMPGMGRRTQFLREIAFPSPAYMQRRYGPAPGGLWPFLYLRRAAVAISYLTRLRSVETSAEDRD